MNSKLRHRTEEEFFYKIQRCMGGKSKWLVDLPPPKLSRRSIRELYNKYEKEWMEFSITFGNMYRVQFSDKQITNIVYYSLQELVGTKTTVLLIPEWGEKNNNLHFHGIIKGAPTRMNDIRRIFKRRFGYTYIKGIHHTPNYIDYILKDYASNVLRECQYKSMFIMFN